ncbi:apolipoprotein N-acyltransferase [Geobacter sp. AOG1]|uniref:apolipoprotein N-acyltransferase n=1 Tax=Geobacter sp. AOG1 TaxID=1566346 RepID=UPI001CC45714|nr:apolipoprotein N-acyltransferase [Geobacter sp. AOG1]GFE58093.1 apolipoprotein N-acyltransferase [Geobacter sp. AOG1]
MDYRRFNMPDFNAIPRRDYLLALLSGVLVALSFPKPALSLLAWFAFVPLLLALGKKSPKKAFKLGFVCGATAFAGLLYWLNIVMVTYGKLHWSVSGCLYLLLVAYLALFVAVPVWLMRRGELAGVSSLVSLPVLWVGLEYLRSFLLSGFPWASLGYSQFRTLPLIQVADITGVYGLSFAIVLANVVVYRILRGLFGREREGYPTAGAVVLLVLLVAMVGYGFYRLRQPEEGKPFRVALIQGNISQDVKWDPAFQEATVAIYERLSRQAVADGETDLVVWPESAAPFFFQNDTTYTPRIRNLARELKTPLVFGSPAFEQDDRGKHYLNSAFLLAPTGEAVGRSDKIHLVPFGEYVPLARFIPFVHKLVEGIGDFSPGERAIPLDTGKGMIGVLVCFEGIFPELSRAYVQAGARVLVNISNDAWYKRSSAPYQHLSMTVFRAVENRVPLVRATNTGITAIIDCRGHVRAATRLFQEAVLTGEVRLGTGATFYSRYGDLFAGLCLAVSAVVGVLGFRRKKSQG